MPGDTTLVHTRARARSDERRPGCCVFRVTRRTLRPQGGSGRTGVVAAGTSMTSPELGDHICFPFDSEPASHSFTAEFAAEGIRRHHRVVLVTHALSPADLRALLAARTRGFTSAVDTGQV